MLKTISASLLAVVFVSFASAQVVPASSGEKWSLLKCVQYAVENNISVKQADLQTRFSELTYKQGRQSQLPTVGFGSNYGFRLGRAENPSTGILEDANIFNINFSLTSQVDIFNWFSKKNMIEASKFSYEADKEQVKKAQDDISLNVAVAYLQILLAREQANITRVLLSTTKEQLNNTRKRVDAGVLPELNAAELEAQLARDSSALITAEASVVTFILQMKALLNLDAGVSFDIDTPPVDRVPVESLADLQPEAVYALALTSLPQNKVTDLRIKSAKKSVESAKGQMYPSIGGFANLGTNYVRFKERPIYNQEITGYTTSPFRTDAGGGIYLPVEAPNFKDGTTVVRYIRPDNFGSQLNANFGQGFGISLGIPIFNGGQLRANWERTKLQVRQWELTRESENQTLKQNIYRAYNEATTAMQKYNADKKSVTTSAKSFEFAQKRYDLNLLSTFDLINSQNNYLRAQIQALYSQYDYVFKMKLLEYYRGQGIKL
jgi:outer membrane protein